MILRPVQAAVALRSADDEAAGRIDEELDLLRQFLGQHRLDDVLDHRFGELGSILSPRLISGACCVDSTTVSIEDAACRRRSAS